MCQRGRRTTNVRFLLGPRRFPRRRWRKLFLRRFVAEPARRGGSLALRAQPAPCLPSPSCWSSPDARRTMGRTPVRQGRQGSRRGTACRLVLCTKPPKRPDRRMTCYASVCGLCAVSANRRSPAITFCFLTHGSARCRVAARGDEQSDRWPRSRPAGDSAQLARVPPYVSRGAKDSH